MNPAPSGPIPDEILRLTDVLVPNESEATDLTGLPVSNSEDAERAALALQQRGVGTVLITMGSAGALAVTASGDVIRVTAPAVKAVDTTGAGDCFIGSLAYFLAVGFDLRCAMENACNIASQSVLANGTQTSFPKRSALNPELFITR